jgi:hypothetical protein
MKCRKCDTEVPRDAGKARFCVSCGRPVSQVCPYHCGEDVLLPLWPPPACCSACGGLIKACSICLRLYPLQTASCESAGCPGALLEPAEPFPVPDGTRAARWRGGLHTPTEPLDVQTMDEVQHLAYRYGLLVAATRYNLVSMIWNGATWEQRGLAAYGTVGAAEVLALGLEEGRAYLMAKDRAALFSLVGIMGKGAVLSGQFAGQSVGRRWWARLENDTGLQVDGVTQPGSWNIALDFPITNVRDIAQEESIYLAAEHASGGGVYAAHPMTSRTHDLAPMSARPKELPFSEECAWLRVAVANDRVLALGRNPDGSVTLATCAVDGQAHRAQAPLEAFDDQYIPDFAWVGDCVYVPRRRGLDTYDVRQLTRAPEHRVSLPAGEDTLPGILALVGPHGETRVILRRRNNAFQQFYLVNPVSGTISEIRPWIPAAETPLLCVADERIVVATRRDGRTTLRTYEIRE